MDTKRPANTLGGAFASHPRDWLRNRYVYPVVSRRADGVSIGVNLNPDKACSFNCVYCQVDRSVPSSVPAVDVDVLRRELEEMLRLASSGRLFAAPPFDGLPETHRRVNDIALSGDGEPTLSPQFRQAVEAAGEIKSALGLGDTKLVLITNACLLDTPDVREALEVMDRNNGEIWAKLDAGTEEYFRRVNRSKCSYWHVLDNIIAAAQVRPIVIQSLWLRAHGQPAPDSEIRAFASRLNEILAAGGRIKLVQIYTVARGPAEPFVTPLSNEQLDHVAAVVRESCDVPIRCYYGVGS